MLNWHSKPISELTAGEAYLRFMDCKGPDDPEFYPLWDRIETLCYGQAIGYAWTGLGGKSGNENLSDLVEKAVDKTFLKIRQQQRRDISPRTKRPVGGIWHPEGNAQGYVAKFETWFNRVVGNNLRAFLKSNDKQPVPISNPRTDNLDQLLCTPLNIKISPSNQNPEKLSIAKEQALMVRSCLRRLENPYRNVLLLMFYEEKSKTEIAEELGTNDSQVTRWKEIAFEQMKGCLGTI